MRPRVLVLDDQKYLRDIIAAVLEDAGYPAVAVASPDEARRCLDEMDIEMLILDMALESTSGLQFLDEVRASPAWATLPVLMVSGDSAKLAEAKGRPHVVILPKPFDVAVLVEATRRVLGSPTLTSAG